jgi:flagellar biosynthetic protein FliS
MNPTQARLAAAQAYHEASIENAPPVVVVRKLFEGALRFLDRAAACDPGRPASGFAENLRRADAIVVELRLALAREAHPELAGRMHELYLFVESSLRRAQRERHAKAIADARAVLATLHDAWSRISIDAPAAAA